MTCNQLIVLACIYRGTDIPTCGTTEADIRVLQLTGFLNANTNDLTKLGRRAFEHVLEQIDG